MDKTNDINPTLTVFFHYHQTLVLLPALVALSFAIWCVDKVKPLALRCSHTLPVLYASPRAARSKLNCQLLSLLTSPFWKFFSKPPTIFSSHRPLIPLKTFSAPLTHIYTKTKSPKIFATIGSAFDSVSPLLCNYQNLTWNKAQSNYLTHHILI